MVGIGVMEIPGDEQVDQEEGEPARALLGGPGSTEEPNVLRRVGHRGPPLLPGHPVYVAISHRPGPHPGEIRAGLGFGQAQAEAGLTTPDAREIPILLLLAPVEDDRVGDDPGGERRAGQPGVSHLVPEDELEGRGTLLAAEPPGPGERQPATVAQGGIEPPHPHLGSIGVVEVAALAVVLLDERPDLFAERFVLVVEERVHGSRSSSTVHCGGRPSTKAAGPSVKSGWEVFDWTSDHPYSMPSEWDRSRDPQIARCESAMA